jgi:plasmid stabilization system protein ParE
MKRSIHQEAERDLGDAARYYLAQAGGAVAARFVDEFERVATLIEANPGYGTPTRNGRRIYPLRGFPYSVIYRITGNEFRVLVVRHQSRNPAFGSERS